MAHKLPFCLASKKVVLVGWKSGLPEIGCTGNLANFMARRNFVLKTSIKTISAAASFLGCQADLQIKQAVYNKQASKTPVSRPSLLQSKSTVPTQIAKILQVLC